ncbi:hypothetical protein [Roseovarius aestuarii]|uniref:Uncharacterized protein n=1 Tax=Roseovarius aestuarii TaxID=475083 RepID=A0A1X7BST2_9RHOB|nr:hypothetical protein [Roseovarius aestuarii]SMC12665.1 hypothetical protein ROA7745_02494 [Roseovarius aestuarii]
MGGGDALSVTLVYFLGILPILITWSAGVRLGSKFATGEHVLVAMLFLLGLLVVVLFLTLPISTASIIALSKDSKWSDEESRAEFVENGFFVLGALFVFIAMASVAVGYLRARKQL